MLPRLLYELLPFIYIVTGILCAVLIDSTIVLISSLLLIVTGVFVLMMRRSFRKALNRRHEQYKAAYEADLTAAADQRSGVERRQREVAQWPVRDDKGEKIVSDRRCRDRRISELGSGVV